MSFNDVHPGDPINAVNVQQVIDALKGTVGKGVPLVVDAVNDSTRYALTLQNDEATNSRALNVLKSDGTVLVKADATGVTLGSPLTLANNSVPGAAIQDASVTNAKLGPDVARANLLTNGGFEIWQRGTSFGPITADAINADFWHTSPGVGSNFNPVIAGTGSQTNNSPRSYGTTYTHAANSFVYQRIENFAELAGKTLSLAIDVTTTTANAIRLFIQYNGSTNTYGTYHTGGGGWQRLTLSVPIPVGITSLVVGLNATVSATFYADNAMLVVGSQPCDYVPLHPADDLARCLRYYYILGAVPSGMPITVGQAGSGTLAVYALQTPSSFATTPTFTISSVTHFQTWNAGTAGLALASGPTLSNFSPPGLAYLTTTVSSGLVAGNATGLISANPLAKMAFEANP